MDMLKNFQKLLLIITVFSVSFFALKIGFSEIKLDKEKILVGQQVIHHGLLETYIHYYAGFYLFLASVFTLYVIYNNFKGSKYGWKPIMVGIFALGLVGAGDTLDHFFGKFGHEFFHYIHVVGIPVTLYFFYRGLKEYLNQFEKKVKSISNLEIVFIFAFYIVLCFIVALKSQSILDRRVEIILVSAVLIPSIVLSVFLLREARKAYLEYGVVIVNIPALSLAATVLGFDILIGRYSHVVENGWLYALTHSLLNIFLVVIGTILIMFAISVSILSKNFRKDLLADWWQELKER